MNISAVLRLLKMKISSADRKAKNPFYDKRNTNPFSKPIYTTIVWIEDEKEIDK